MITVHHLAMSQSERIVWLCEELDLPYDLRRYERDPQTRAAPPEYKALHPAGTAPIVTDGDLVLAETGAIIEYIARRYAGGRLLLDAGDPDFAQFLLWFHYGNGSFMPGMMMDLVAQRLGGSATSGRGERGFALAEARLGEAPWFAGEAFTAADIMMVFPLTTMRAYSGRDLSDVPNIRAYLQRVGARPAYQRAMAKAEPGTPPRLT